MPAERSCLTCRLFLGCGFRFRLDGVFRDAQEVGSNSGPPAEIEIAFRALGARCRIYECASADVLKYRSQQGNR